MVTIQKIKKLVLHLQIIQITLETNIFISLTCDKIPCCGNNHVVIFYRNCSSFHIHHSCHNRHSRVHLIYITFMLILFTLVCLHSRINHSSLLQKFSQKLPILIRSLSSSYTRCVDLISGTRKIIYLNFKMENIRLKCHSIKALTHIQKEIQIFIFFKFDFIRKSLYI